MVAENYIPNCGITKNLPQCVGSAVQFDGAVPRLLHQAYELEEKRRFAIHRIGMPSVVPSAATIFKKTFVPARR
jgi:hypothetical protein